MPIRFFPNQQNFIKSVLTHPCARPWYIWVETFLPAFIELLFTTAVFDLNDAIRAHGETIVREGKGRKGKRHSPRIRVTGHKNPVDRWAQRGLKTLLVITEPLERIGFIWLLYSAVDQFFLNWQTLLESSDFCSNPINSGPLQLSRGPGTVSIVASFIPVILNVELQDRAGWPHSTLSAAIPEGVYAASFALTVIGPIGGVTNVKIRLRTPGAFGDDVTESDPLALANGEEGSMVVRHDFFYPVIGGGTITWEVGGESIPIGIETVKGHMFCMRTG